MKTEEAGKLKERAMISRVFKFMEKYKMIEENDLVAVGVSGGADSLCLLSLLCEYRNQVEFFPIVVHVDHGLRQQAKEEAAYVKELCEKKGLAFYLKEIQAEEVAKKRGISIEEAGRLERYRAFEEALEIYGKKEAEGKKIAVAHHRADQAETMLFHLFRGTGINGMAGIMPVRDKIIRPLLAIGRGEIEQYLTDRNIFWYEDESNALDCYTRNKIRHRILGYAKREINEKAVEHVSAAAMQIVELKDFLQEELKKAEESCCFRSEQEICVQIPQFLTCHSFLRGQLLLKILGEVAPGRKDIGEIHIEEILKLLTKEGSRQLDLPGKIRVRKEYHLLVIERTEKKEKEVLERRELKEGEYQLDDENILEIKILGKEDFFTIEENQYTKYLDYGKINNSLCLRTRETGDYIVINDRGQKKSVKEYMIQEKIPGRSRDFVPVIADGSHILWMVGYRISAYYKISDRTEKIIRMKIKRRE